MCLSLFAASCLVLCYLLSCSVAYTPLKCIWSKFNVIWRTLQSSNAYADIILCNFSMVGHTSPHWLQPPRHCIYLVFKQYMCACWFTPWRFMLEMCRLPNSDMAAANLRFGSCQALVYSGVAAAKLRQVPNQSLGNEELCAVNILATFHFVLCWLCLVLFCSILSKCSDLCGSVPI